MLVLQKVNKQFCTDEENFFGDYMEVLQMENKHKNSTKSFYDFGK